MRAFFFLKSGHLFLIFEKRQERPPPTPLVARLTIMVVPMLTNHNDVIWQLFDPVEVYKKVHSLKRVFMRKHYFGM